MKHYKAKIIGDEPCPGCRAQGRDRTGNHLMLFADGGAYCNRCGYTVKSGSHTNELAAKSSDESGHPIPSLQLGKGSRFPGAHSDRDNNKMSMKTPTIEDILSYPIRAIPERGISLETCQHLGIRVAVSEKDGSTITDHFYPVYKKGRLSGFKGRRVDTKSFYAVGDTKQASLFGKDNCRSGKTVYVTEGELDAASVWQTLREKSSLPDYSPSVVSIPNGAGGISSLTNDMEFLSTYEKIVFIFDQDEAGQEGLKKACHLFPGKSYYIDLPYKDPNEMYLEGKGEELKWLLVKPKKYQPDNIVNAADLWERYKEGSNVVSYPYPSEWVELNKKTYGVRPGSLVTVASGSGCGKTQFLRELKYHYHKTCPEWSFADISLEESVEDSMAGLMALHLNKRIQLPDVEVEEKEEKEAFEYLFSDRRWDMYDHFGGMGDDSLFTKIRYYAASGRNVIFLDHLSIIVSEYASDGGERERIDTIMTRLAKIAKEFGLIIFLVVHLKKSNSMGPSFEEGAKPSLDDLRGSGSIKQLSWDVLFLTRNQQHPSSECANTSMISVGKCRFTGRTGDSDYLYFDDTTGRMVKVERPFGWDVGELKSPKPVRGVAF